MLTRKNYEAIAEIIRMTTEGRDIESQVRNTPHDQSRFDGTIETANIVATLSDYFYADNFRFDFVKFRDACGYPAKLGNFPQHDSSGWSSPGVVFEMEELGAQP